MRSCTASRSGRSGASNISRPANALGGSARRGVAGASGVAVRAVRLRTARDAVPAGGVQQGCLTVSTDRRCAAHAAGCAHRGQGCPGATAPGRCPRHGNGFATEASRTAAPIGRGGPDANHAGRGRRGDHAGRREQPLAGVRHRWRSRPGQVPFDDQRPEGSCRHAVLARRGAGAGGWSLHPGAVRHLTSWRQCCGWWCTSNPTRARRSN